MVLHDLFKIRIISLIWQILVKLVDLMQILVDSCIIWLVLVDIWQKMVHISPKMGICTRFSPFCAEFAEFGQNGSLAHISAIFGEILSPKHGPLPIVNRQIYMETG